MTISKIKVSNTTHDIHDTRIGPAGSTSSPVYFNANGVPTAVTSFPEAYLSWGGKNFSASYGCIDAAMVPQLGAARTMFAKAEGIIVEYSTDGGTTWVNYGASDDLKLNLFSVGIANLITGKNSTAAGRSANNMLRVTLLTSPASIYTSLNKFVIYVSTNSSTGSYCTIRCRTQENYENNVDTWVTRADQVGINGWTGYNVINITSTTTYGNNKASQYGEWQFIFGYTGFSESSTGYGLSIYGIWGFGGVGWTTPSNMAKHGHLYTYSAAQTATFPSHILPAVTNKELGNSTYRWYVYGTGGNFNNSITANSFIKSSGTSSQFLKADGSVDSNVYEDVDNKTTQLSSTSTDTQYPSAKVVYDNLLQKTDKVSEATSGNLAGLDSSGNLTDSGLSATNVAQKGGSYSGMTVGMAEDLVSTESMVSEFTSRITGGSTAVGKGGTALVDKIKGRTLVWNQLVQNGNFENGTDGFTIYRATSSVSDKELTLTISSGNTSGCFYKDINVVLGHKYLIFLNAKKGSATTTSLQVQKASTATVSTTLGTYEKLSIITTASGSTAEMRILGWANGEAGETASFRNMCVFDLTLMFGSGNEPATVEGFEALYSLPYYDYCTGKLVNNGLQDDYDLTWNQLCPEYWFANKNINGITFTNNGDGSYTVNGTASADSEISGFSGSGKTSWGDHKYYLSVSDVNIGLYFDGDSADAGSIQKNKQIITANAAEVYSPTLYIVTGKSFSNKKIYIRIHDLTLMFGVGNEPTIEEFEAMFPAVYYPYDTGTQQHFSFPQFKTKIETVGWNIWDEKYELGGINTSTGNNTTSSNRLRSASFSPIFGGKSYYCYCGTDSYAVGYFYDKDKNYISYLGAGSFSNKEFVAPNSASYLRFALGTAYGVTYNHDICISLSDTSRNGTYEPYWRSELELGLGDVKVKSHNLWDEEWENGTIEPSTGGSSSNSDYIRSKNYIPIIGGASYYVKRPNATGHYNGYIYYYDINKNYLGLDFRETVYNTTGKTFTAPTSAFYAKLTIQYATYTNDICINLSNPSFNGRYESYGNGGIISITGGLKSAGAVYDEIRGNKLLKRIESVDLGTLDWTYSSALRFVSAGLVGKIKSPDVDEAGNVISTRFQSVSYSNLGLDRSVCVIFTGSNSAGQLWLYDSAYTDAITFKAAMSEVPLYYELAQPIEYELAEAIPTAMHNDPYGTERRLPEDTTTVVTAPFRADIIYSTNIKEAVQSLPQNYINVNSMQDFLSALGALMGGTWTIRPVDGKFDFIFTPNSSN